jgi:hypothetical protein
MGIKYKQCEPRPAPLDQAGGSPTSPFQGEVSERVAPARFNLSDRARRSGLGLPLRLGIASGRYAANSVCRAFN